MRQSGCLCLFSHCSHLSRSVESNVVHKSLHDPGGSSVATKVVVPDSSGSSGGSNSGNPHAVESAGATPLNPPQIHLQKHPPQVHLGLPDALNITISAIGTLSFIG